MREILAIYLRLSKSDDDIISNSVLNQRDLIYSYIKNHAEFENYDVVEYCDDGYSGTTLDRPQFNEMLSEAEFGRIKCIIVKDFSRFGRNSIEVGSYIEEIFPYTGLRFISINDQYDSKDYFGDTGGFEVSIKNFIAQTYAQDASMKIKSNFKAKAESGQFIAFKQIYGYVVTQDKKLILDKEPASVVAMIFEMRFNNVSLNDIAKKLNQENYLIPKLYFKYKTIKRTPDITELSLWDRTKVSSILDDERYTGKLIYGRYRSKSIRSKTFIKTNREDWIIIENSHPAIVNEEVFFEIQSRKVKLGTPHPVKTSLFVKKIFCKECGRYFSKTTYQRNIFKCKTALLQDDSTCYKDGILEKSLADAVLKILKIYAQTFFDKFESEESNHQSNYQEKLKSIKRSIRSKEIIISTGQIKKEELFELLTKEEISDELYVQKSNNLDLKIVEAEVELEKLQQEKQILEDKLKEKEQIISRFKNVCQLSVLNKEVIDNFVEKILVDSNGSIEIVWKFNDELLKHNLKGSRGKKLFAINEEIYENYKGLHLCT